MKKDQPTTLELILKARDEIREHAAKTVPCHSCGKELCIYIPGTGIVNPEPDVPYLCLECTVDSST